MNCNLRVACHKLDFGRFNLTNQNHPQFKSCDECWLLIGQIGFPKILHVTSDLYIAVLHLLGGGDVQLICCTVAI